MISVQQHTQKKLTIAVVVVNSIDFIFLLKQFNGNLNWTILDTMCIKYLILNQVWSLCSMCVFCTRFKYVIAKSYDQRMIKKAA